ncbi:winged helix DNA-binding domain-containing protein [Nocardia sp. CC227C]|uniref:winged helix DNA-binding domain-containing protein n=1 Tax=Nocardia sp. CC227C TaxID=3044562 RepID=UPI00278C51FA|nr:winged helix DNA-binding domain-containing protein [Nocardia sp. CC227C]
MRVSWDQVFAWRMRRQFVDPRGDVGAVEIARRLCGVQAQVTSAAETAVAVRRSAGEPGAVVRALEQAALVKTWAMRGTLHALPPDSAAAVLSLVASARTWEKPSWQKTFGATPDEVAALARAVAGILDGAVLTRDELVAALAAKRRFQPMATELRSGWGALLKPLAWQGALCHGPARGTAVTFTNPASLIPDWPGIPEPDSAAPEVITAYLGAYGPSTPEAFDAWLTRGSIRKSVLRQWFSDLGDRLTTVDVQGRQTYIRTEHADELAATAPAASVRLLGAFDQYVLGPGTKDTALLPGNHRAKVSRTAGWIAPLVLVDGRIAGTWETDAEELVVAMFDDAALPDLKAELGHIARATGQPLTGVRSV